ncbi:MAG: hypothetical protein R8K20_01035 [Gallionellaceae bacterium]
MEKLSGSDITLGEPLTFSLHDASGRLLLSKGYVITSSSAVEKLLRLNAEKGNIESPAHDSSSAANTPSNSDTSSRKTPRDLGCRNSLFLSGF